MDLLVPDVPSVDPAANLALEEALVRAASPVPLLRIWQNEACVVLGRGQRLDREVNVAACAAASVPVLRRASGGGTVYHDLGNLNITLAVPAWAPGLVEDLTALVAGVLRRLGLAPSATKRGVFVDSVKVSGLASQLTRAATLAHATLLVTTPASRIGAFLAPVPPDTHPLGSRRSPCSRCAKWLLASAWLQPAGWCWQGPGNVMACCHHAQPTLTRSAGRSGCWRAATEAAHGMRQAVGRRIALRRRNGRQNPP